MMDKPPMKSLSQWKHRTFLLSNSLCISNDFFLSAFAKDMKTSNSEAAALPVESAMLPSCVCRPQTINSEIAKCVSGLLVINLQQDELKLNYDKELDE